MNRLYKITAVLAVVLCGGIISYHLLQSDPSNGQNAIVTTNDTQPVPSDADPSQQQPANLTDLMSRIRHHIDQTNATPTDPPPIKPPPPTVAEPPKAAPQAPAITFDQIPSRQPAAAAPTDVEPKAATPTPDSADSPPAPTHQRETANPPDSPATVDLENAEAPTPSRTYTVQTSDTFSTIAVKIYGSEKHWIDIAAANPFVDPNRLQIGQSIRLPDHKEVLNQDDHASTYAQSPMITHVVKIGESLSMIAQHYYNNPGLWRVIFEVNRDTIGHDPDQLQAGEVLRIPPEHVPAR